MSFYHKNSRERGGVHSLIRNHTLYPNTPYKKVSFDVLQSSTDLLDRFKKESDKPYAQNLTQFVFEENNTFNDLRQLYSSMYQEDLIGDFYREQSKTYNINQLIAFDDGGEISNIINDGDNDVDKNVDVKTPEENKASDTSNGEMDTGENTRGNEGINDDKTPESSSSENKEEPQPSSSEETQDINGGGKDSEDSRDGTQDNQLPPETKEEEKPGDQSIDSPENKKKIEDARKKADEFRKEEEERRKRKESEEKLRKDQEAAAKEKQANETPFGSIIKTGKDIDDKIIGSIKDVGESILGPGNPGVIKRHIDKDPSKKKQETKPVQITPEFDPIPGQSRNDKNVIDQMIEGLDDAGDALDFIFMTPSERRKKKRAFDAKKKEEDIQRKAAEEAKAETQRQSEIKMGEEIERDAVIEKQRELGTTAKY